MDDRDDSYGPFAVWGIRISEDLPERPTFPTFAEALEAAESDLDGAGDVEILITNRIGVKVWSDEADED